MIKPVMGALQETEPEKVMGKAEEEGFTFVAGLPPEPSKPSRGAERGDLRVS